MTGQVTLPSLRTRHVSIMNSRVSPAMQSAASTRRSMVSFLGQELLLVAALDDVDDDEGHHHEVERTLRHGFDRIAKEAEMGNMAAFRHQHDSDQEQHEQA